MRKLATLIGVILLYAACKNGGTQATLPIYGNRDTKTITKDGKQVVDTIYQTIPAFRFVNQYGDSITQNSLKGDIYVADFFFTTCPSICPIMHRNMLKVYSEFKNVSDFKIISHSIDPKHDSVPILKKYADGLGISGNSWWLLQGKKDDTYNLSASYLVRRPEESAKELFIHDGYFVLIDKQKRIRGSYDGTDEKDVARMIGDIKTLRAETNPQIAQ
ncbi:SCO family protein [Mucilaginibacter sp. ZT4R22]|uniref:SCO family protein n=1 Tax=Mucilaginibacter pankratovii TaxID=2772110 RepID=A0ABR7WYC3_9SPHI|nr:SCO family protein [Mucilaginibacter pankratovii]MBD1367275.1 SCO family protein [Mucilaginibacter pankratovii]